MTKENEYIITCNDDLYPLMNRVAEFYKANPNSKASFKVTIKQNRAQRSLKQNAFFKGVFSKYILEFYEKDPSKLPRDLFLLLDVELTLLFIHDFLRLSFNNGKSTAKNDVQEMEKMILDIRSHYFHHHGFDIPLPNDGEENEE